MNDTYNAFHEFFEIVDVNSEELLKEVYRLRYRVFCLDNHFLDAADYPDGLENDEHDCHSAHILLKHRPSGCFVGTVRLILQNPISPTTPFPIEKFTQIDSKLVDIEKMPRQQLTEISRFTILGEFFGRRCRHGKRDSQPNSQEKQMIERRRFPNICLALAVGVVQMSAKYNINHWLSVMDPMLNRLLKYYGLGLHSAGPLTNYHGMRRPYYIKFKDLLDNLYLNHREIWELVTDYGNACPYPLPQVHSGYTVGEKQNFRPANTLIHT